MEIQILRSLQMGKPVEKDGEKWATYEPATNATIGVVVLITATHAEFDLIQSKLAELPKIVDEAGKKLKSKDVPPKPKTTTRPPTRYGH